MQNKALVTILTVLLSTVVYSTTKYPGLTHNYDSVLQANINDVINSHNSNTIIKHLRSVRPNHLVTPILPINLNNIKLPVHKRFTDASLHFSEQIIYGKGSKQTYELSIYILKDQLNRLIDQNHLICEYKMELGSNYGNKYYLTLNKKKKDYLNYASDTGFKASSFIDQDFIQGYIKEQSEFNGGLVHVLIKNRVLSLIASDCTKTVSKEQIMKDLTEWGELLIEANK